MWKRIVPSAVALLVALLAVPGASSAQEEKPAEFAAPEMAEMMAAGAPGEMHKILEKTVGTWDVTVKAWMDPASPPMEMTGVAKTEMIMGGRYAAERVDSEFMGMPFEGLGITGYNQAAERFESTWIDNMSTTLFTYTGNLEGDDLTLSGSFKDPMSGETVMQRSVLTFVDADHYMVRGYETRGGEERMTMEIHYMRAN